MSTVGAGPVLHLQGYLQRNVVRRLCQGLFIIQSEHGINEHGAAGGNVTCREGDKCQQNRNSANVSGSVAVTPKSRLDRNLVRARESV